MCNWTSLALDWITSSETTTKTCRSRHRVNCPYHTTKPTVEAHVTEIPSPSRRCSTHNVKHTENANLHNEYLVTQHDTTLRTPLLQLICIIAVFVIITINHHQKGRRRRKSGKSWLTRRRQTQLSLSVKVRPTFSQDFTHTAWKWRRYSLHLAILFQTWDYYMKKMLYTAWHNAVRCQTFAWLQLYRPWINFTCLSGIELFGYARLPLGSFNNCQLLWIRRP